MKLASLFSGVGGLDLGFVQAGFETIYANDISKDVWETYEKNLGINIDRRSLFNIPSEDIPKVDGIIGGPPCQSWSLAGEMRGILDERGKLFYEYIRVIADKNPKFFVAENVPGISSRTHKGEFYKITKKMEELGYSISINTYDSRDYGVPQERRRVIIVGYQKDLGTTFEPPIPTHSKEGWKNLDGLSTNKWRTIKEAIYDLPEAVPALDKNKPNPRVLFPNHEFMVGDFSSIYMSRNRRRDWDQQSYTIQAGGRHAPLHPDSCSMKKVEDDKWEFTGKDFRRLTVREAARIQTFPDEFIFYYNNVSQGYKMVGNAVPVGLAKAIGLKIAKDLGISGTRKHKRAMLGIEEIQR